MPAALTTTSTRPCRVCTLSTARLTARSSLTSTGSSPCVSKTATLTPRALSRSAVARPIPLAPPVTTATRITMASRSRPCPGSSVANDAHGLRGLGQRKPIPGARRDPSLPIPREELIEVLPVAGRIGDGRHAVGDANDRDTLQNRLVDLDPRDLTAGEANDQIPTIPRQTAQRLPDVGATDWVKRRCRLPSRR